VTSPTDRADQYWAAVFEVERSQLRRPGLHITYVDDPSAGIYVLELDETVRVRAPRHRASEVDGLRIDAALDGDAWRVALRGSDPVVLGPAAHYLASENVGSSQEATDPTLAEVERMIAGISPEEVEESGVLGPDIDRFGLWVDGTLAAVSSLSPWVGGRTDVGLLVAPEFRGRGLGRQVAVIALNNSTRGAGIARWRCREDNAASVALATGFRLQPYARNLGIRL
jgi:RimJ/RimL family protein N-acetyltransferase